VKDSTAAGVYSIFEAGSQWNGAYKLSSFRAAGIEFGYISSGQLYMADANNAGGAITTISSRGVATAPNIYGDGSNGGRTGVAGVNNGTANAGTAGVVGQGLENAGMIAESRGTTNDSMIITSRTLTTGRLAYFEQLNSAFSGDALQMNLGQGTGSFTGNFLNFKVNGTQKMVVTASGSVGIGTATPRAALDVAGAIVGQPAVLNGTTVINFSNGNTQYTTSDCGSFQFNNLKDGGTYTFIVQGTNEQLCSFTGFSDSGSTALTVHLPPDHGPTMAGRHTVYNLVVGGTHVYLSWTPGY
jgi:hypothetical protein